jgi:hypothetical protein
VEAGGIEMKLHLEYFWYVVRHKWFVFIECCKLDIPWLGIVHDCSRFRPSEWFAYVASQPYNKNSKPPKITLAFIQAWNDHQHRNRHHWEYWVHFDYHNHEMILLPMPDRYRCEMLADWRGASRAKKTSSVRDWYLANESKMKLEPSTREWIEAQLGV